MFWAVAVDSGTLQDCACHQNWYWFRDFYYKFSGRFSNMFLLEHVWCCHNTLPKRPTLGQLNLSKTKLLLVPHINNQCCFVGANTISGCDLAAHVAALQLTSFQRSRTTALGVIHLVRTIGVRREEPGAVAPTLECENDDVICCRRAKVYVYALLS